MPDERTCRTCWHWDVIEPGQGLCGHQDTGGAVHGAEDTCCNHLAIVGCGGDWQPHEQLSGGSAPAEDWREPMVDTSNSSNPTEAHVGKHLLTGGLRPEDVEPDPQAIMAERDLLKQRVAELSRDNWNLHEALSVAEAEMQPTEVCPACNGDVPWGKPGVCYLCGNMGVVTKERLLRIDAFRQCEAANKRIAELEAAREIDQKVIARLGDACDRTCDVLALARRWAAAWKRAASKFRSWQSDTEAELELERRAVEALAEHIEIACEGFSHGSMSAITVAPGGYMDAAEIAAWARNRALEEGGEPDGA